MAKLSILGGATSKLLKIFVEDSSSSSGGGLTGLTSGSSGLIAYYIREGDSSATVISLTSATVGTFTSSGFKEVDATHMPGVYELGIPNAAIASGAKSVLVMLSGATNMVPSIIEIELTATDNQDGTRGGMTALPNANAGATNGLPLAVDSSGRVDVLKVNGTSQTARDLGASVLLSSGTGTGQLDITSGQVKIQSGQITLKKNVALANFSFPMVDAGGHRLTGLTVTAQRILDGGSQASMTNSATEIGTTGSYKIDIAAADTNCNSGEWIFTATGAQDTIFVFITQP